MGHSECATAMIGYRVRIQHLLESIHDEKSCKEVYDTLTNQRVFVEDENDEDNLTFMDIIYSLEKSDEPWQTVKEAWMNEFRSLIQHDLLIPLYSLVDTTRWGYNREGMNGSSVLISPSFLTSMEQWQQTCPPHHTLVWIIRQSS